MTVKFVKRNAYIEVDGITFDDASLTQQQYQAECDVNRQIERLSRHLDSTGMDISTYNNIGAMYGDFSEIPDFVTYNNAVCEAKEKFDMLPTNVRERFGYSPEKLFTFLLDENNKDEAIKLGLVNAPILKDIKEDISITTPDIKMPDTESSASAETP